MHYMQQSRALVASFIAHRPALLHKMPDDEAGSSGPWPSHRTWGDFVTKFVAAQLATPGMSHSVINDLIAGSVGAGAALEFMSWRRELDLPDPEVLIESPALFQVMGRPDLTFAVLSSVTSAIVAKNSNERWCAGWEILCRAAEQGALDVATVSAKTLANAQPSGAHAPIKVLDVFGPMLETVQRAKAAA